VFGSSRRKTKNYEWLVFFLLKTATSARHFRRAWVAEARDIKRFATVVILSNVPNSDGGCSILSTTFLARLPGTRVLSFNKCRPLAPAASCWRYVRRKASTFYQYTVSIIELDISDLTTRTGSRMRCYRTHCKRPPENSDKSASDANWRKNGRRIGSVIRWPSVITRMLDYTYCGNMLPCRC